MKDWDRILTRWRRKVREGLRDLTPADRSAVLTFDDEYSLTDVKAPSRLKAFANLVRLAEAVPGLERVLDDREAAKEYVRYIDDKYDNPSTADGYRSALRQYGRVMTDGDGFPETVAWIPANTEDRDRTAPAEADLLDWWEHVVPMALAAGRTGNPVRNAAVPPVLFEIGGSGGEVFGLTLGDITDPGGETLMVHVTGSRQHADRDVPLIASVPWLRRWLDAHPADSTDEEAPLWCKPDGSPFVYRTFTNILDLLAERADVTRPVTPTNYRKSNLRWLCEINYHAHNIESRQGRAPGSDAVARYKARFGPASAQSRYETMFGVETDVTEPEDFRPVPCPGCQQLAPAGLATCPRCGTGTGAPGQAGPASLGQMGEEELKEMIRSVVREETGDDLDERYGIPAVRRYVEREVFLDDVESAVDEALGLPSLGRRTGTGKTIGPMMAQKVGLESEDKI